MYLFDISNIGIKAQEKEHTYLQYTRTIVFKCFEWIKQLIIIH